MNTVNITYNQVVMAQSKEDLMYMGRKLQEEYSKWGFTTNIAERKYMSVGTDTNHLEMDNGDIITGCTEFRYLGTIFTTDGRDTKKYTPQGNKSTENNRSIMVAWGGGMVVKEHNKKPEKGDL